MIRVQNLRKTFGSRIAVNGIGLEIRRGETLGLLGPNGAGKTTTIHMMTGILRPDSGEILIDESADPTRVNVRCRIGLAPQSLAIYDDMTAEENLFFLGRLYGIEIATLRGRVAELLELAELADRRRDFVRTFSGGMKRRLNLVAALVHKPDVLFLDEPTVGVDPQSRNHLFDCVGKLARQGTTIVYTTHYMEEAERLCDRVAIIDKGVILALDTVDQLRRRYGGNAMIVVDVGRDPAKRAEIRSFFAAILPNREIFEGESQLRMSSADPLQDLANLAGSQIDPRSIQLENPQLETVFLNLTGRRLRDS